MAGNTGFFQDHNIYDPVEQCHQSEMVSLLDLSTERERDLCHLVHRYHSGTSPARRETVHYSLVVAGYRQWRIFVFFVP